MPINLIKPLGNGKFQTPNGVFNSYQEAAMSVGVQPQYGVPHSPAMSNPTPALDALNKAAGTPAVPDIALQSSPMQFKPQQPKQYGGRGEVGMPTKPQNLLDIPQPPQQERSFMDKLFSKEGLGAISNAYLAASQDPALQRMGVAGLQQLQATKKQNRTIEDLRKFGMPEEQISMLANNPDLLKIAVSEMYKSKYGTSTPADQQAFENLIKDFSEEDKIKARRVKAGLDARAGSQFNLSPEELALRQYFTTGGKLTAEQEVENAKLAAGRAAGQRMFEYGLSNLEESLAGTTTGKLAGYLPAITASQQKADQAVAMLAPILKQTFRAAGEGVFTDKDQELLMAMIPTRGSSTAVIQSAIQALNQLVMLKLETGAEVEGLAKRFGIDVKMPEQPAQVGTSGFSIKGVK